MLILKVEEHGINECVNTMELLNECKVFNSQKTYYIKKDVLPLEGAQGNDFRGVLINEKLIRLRTLKI